jgi:hypothetical protein
LIENPEYLYHGRTTKVDIILPEQTFDSRGLNKDNLFAIYATPCYRFFLDYAFGIADHDRRKFNLQQPGYVYKLNPKDFYPIDNDQWVSLNSVKPVSFKIVYPFQYLHIFLDDFRRRNFEFETDDLVGFLYKLYSNWEELGDEINVPSC